MQSFDTTVNATGSEIITRDMCPCQVVFENPGSVTYFVSWQGNDTAGIPVASGVSVTLRTRVRLFGITASGTANVHVSLPPFDSPVT